MKVESLSQRLPNIVDDLQFGSALFRLFEQALSFFEKAHILDGSAHIGGNSLKHPNRKIGKGIFSFKIRNGNATDDLSACQQWKHNPGFWNSRSSLVCQIFASFFQDYR